MAENKLSEQLDIFFDRSRKTIQQWVTSYTNAELQRINGNIVLPIKKPLIDIYEAIMLDPHLSSVVQQRQAKVLNEEFAVFNEDGNIDDEATKAIKKKWFSKTQELTVESIFYGYSLIEIENLVNGEIKNVKSISRGNVVPELRSVVKSPYQVTLGSLIKLDKLNDSDYYILVDSEKLGILNKVVINVLIKRVAMSYWGNHTEQYSVPMTILKTDNRDQTAKYQADLKKFVTNRNIVIGLSDELEMLSQSGTDSHEIYNALIERCNSEISKAILSQTMTTDNGSSRSQSEVHMEVANEIAEADREYVTNVINDIVFPKLINLGYKLAGKTFGYISKEKRTYEEKLKTIFTLVKETGYKIHPDNVEEYLDLPFEVELGDSSEAKVTVKKKVQSKVS